MRFLKNMVLYVAVASLFFACTTKKSMIISLPDQEGRTGTVEVSGKAGTQVLDQPYHMTQIEDTKESPTMPQPMDPDRVQEMFSGALTAQPEIPVRFILYFKTDTAEFTEASENLLPEVIDYLKQSQSGDISITAHTDRTASKEYNKALSLKRLKQVTGALVSGGVDPDTLETTYHGEANPLIDTEDEVAEPRNRRVEVVIK